MLHSIGTPQPKASVLVKVFNSPNAAASVHGFIQPGLFIETAPVTKTPGRTKKCYHAGSGKRGSRNSNHIGIEMSEPSTIKYTGGASFKDLNPEATKKFVTQVTDTAAQVFADLCIFHNLSVSSITTHRQSHLDGFASNHGDPEHLWKVINYTLADFRKDVQKYINAKKGDVLALMTKEEFESILDAKLAAVKVPVYQTIDDVPDAYKPSVQKCMDKKILAGTGKMHNGKPVIGLSRDLARTLTILDRAGVFDAKEEKPAGVKQNAIRANVTK